MKSPLTKLTAAAVIIIAALPLVLFFDRGLTPIYALEQTIEANHAIKTIYLRIAESDQNIENNEFTDCWIKYDDAGLVSKFRCNIYEDGEDPAYAVWNEGVLKIWRPSQNTVMIIRVNDMEKYWEDFAKEYDPKLIFQWLYVSRGNQANQLHIDKPAEDSNSIYVTATNSIDKMRLKLVIDPKTKLVKKLLKYRLGEKADRLDTQIDVLAYNQSINPSMFELSGIPDDALVVDQIDQLVGLEQGNLTNNEIVVKVVRETLEATIAKDYEKVSRLMEGVPGNTVEEFIKEEFDARIVRVISTGQPEPHERSGYHIYVPCEIEVENEERGKWTVNIIAMTEFISYQAGRRWVMHCPDKDDGSHISSNNSINAQDGIGEKLIIPGERMGDFRLGINKDDVLKKLGKPKAIFLGSEKYTLNNLPRRFFMVYNDISFSIDDDIVIGISAHSLFYKFTNGLGVGDSEQKIKQTFGEDFHFHEGRWKDFLIYEDRGLEFEIDKKDRTVVEINVAQAKDHQRNRDIPDNDKKIMLSEKTSGPITFPKIDRRPKPEITEPREMNILPKYDPNSNNPFQIDLRCRDLRKLDLHNSIKELMHTNFDDRTVWPAPDRMPSGFDWQKIMKLGKNPGLGIRSLHEKGITGRGVRIAIIDQPLLVDHQEYAERLRLYEEIHIHSETEPQMHGPAVASIAVGKTVGVAPEAELFYIAQFNFNWEKGHAPTLRYLAQGINRILEINEQLPEGKKIRVISISKGWTRSHKEFKLITEAVQKARDAGMLIVCASVELVHDGFAFGELGRPPLADPEVFESYEPSLFFANTFWSGRFSPTDDCFWVPIDSRTTASPNGSNEYVFYRQGGVSWAIPYIAGLYALAVQVDSAITPERFWDLAIKTGRTTELEHKGEKRPFGPIIDPVRLIRSISDDAGTSRRAPSKNTIVPGVGVGEYTFGMSKDEVLKKLGEPEVIQLGEDEFVRRGEKKYSLNNLPRKYIMSFGNISFFIHDDSVGGIIVRSPLYKLSNGLKVGDSEQKIKQAFGEDFQLREDEGKEYLLSDAERLAFEIHKENRTVTEILVFQPESDRGDRDAPDQQEQLKGTIVPGVGVGDYKLGMRKDDVLRKLGEPGSIFFGSETYTLDNLPRRYFMSYEDVSFSINDDVVTGITALNSSYKFASGVGVGDSEEKVKQVFGNDFQLEEFERIDILTYNDKGLSFEISKEDRTVVEINVTQTSSRGRESSSIQPIPTIKPFDDVRAKDISKYDLSTQRGLIAKLQFNRETVWPERTKMPPGSDPEKILTNAMNPGLGVHELHRQGITGKGVNVAIIDQPLFKDHPEYNGKIAAYHDTGCDTDNSSMHGPAVTSLLVGTNCGTAPDARVYYAAAPSWKADAAFYAKGLEWIIEQNGKLPEANKIRVVSVSAAPNQSSWANRQMWDEACARADADGIMVLDCTDSHRGFINRGWYDPGDPENVSKFNLGVPPKREVRVDPTEMSLYVPSSCRTTVQHYDYHGRNSYIYWARGGLSWSIPYCAGMLAMGWQIRPDLTPAQMKELLFASAHIHESGAKIIHPTAFIDLVRKQGKNQHLQKHPQPPSGTLTIVPGARVGNYTLDMSKDDVLKKLGEPEVIYSIQIEKGEGIHRGEEECSLKSLPEHYILSFRDVSFWMDGDSIEVICVHSPLYKLSNGLGVGDSEQKIKQAFGEDFKLEEVFGKDFHCYHAKGLGFQIREENRTVAGIVVYRPEGDDRDNDSSEQEADSTQIIVPGVGMGGYTLDMDRDDVLRRLGKPRNIHYGGEDYTLDNLPKRYFMFYHGISFYIVEEAVTGIATHSPRYKFANGLKVGDSEDKLKQAFGSDFKLEEFERMDAIIYEEKGLRFEIDKKTRTIEEIGINQVKRNQRNMNIPKVQHRDDLGPYEDISGKDLRASDLRYSEDILDTLEFNQETQWPPPELLPEGFDPQVLLQEGMNPGLGVRDLHAQGITGAGVHVGLIDQPLLLDHPEYAGKIVSYHALDCGSHKSSMHGPAMASQLVGKRCGTAPGAKLHVVAVPSWKADATYYARALNRFVAYNENASKGQKIRVVSVSCQPSGDGSIFKNQSLWDEAVQRAQAKGILVLDCTWHHGFVSLCWLDPQNRESVEACTPGFRLGEVEVDEGHIHVPSAPRTAAEADEDGSFGYAYDGGGRRSRRPKAKNGYSDTIPYAAGILALGWQICPELTPAQMKELLFASAYVHESGARIIHPKAFIDLVRSQSDKGIIAGDFSFDKVKRMGADSRDGMLQVVSETDVQVESGEEGENDASDINEKVAQICTGLADFSDVITIFGQPSDYKWRKQRFKLEDLPVERYWIFYNDSIHILMYWDKVDRLEIVDSAYVFNDKIPMGSSLEHVLSIVGQPKATVVGQRGWEDGVLYKDIEGRVGWCQYTRKDLNADFRFLNYTLRCVSIFLEVKSGEEGANDTLDINERIAQILTGPADFNDVIMIFGQPSEYKWDKQRFKLEDLPVKCYWIRYPDSIHIFMNWDKVDRLEIVDPAYVYNGKIPMGSSLESVLSIVGQPNKTVVGQQGWEDSVLYKDINGSVGRCYYRRDDLNVDFRFSNNTLKCVSIFKSKDSSTIGRTTKRGSFQTGKTIKSVNEFDDVRAKDLSKLDLSSTKGLIAKLTFNQETVWPEQSKMPPGSNPQKILADAMNPGLGVRELHQQDITGKGVSVAIIDQPLFKDHPEYDGKIVAYFDTGCGPSESSMHGPAVASLLVGTNCGTAPDARIYYAAAPSWKRDTAYEAKALDWIIEQNKKLPVGQKIRVVSVSAAPSSPNVRDKNQEMWDEACARAEADGIMVLDCTNSPRGFINRGWYDPADPESVNKFNPGPPPKREITRNLTESGLFVPSSCRTTAQHYDYHGRNSYIYWGRGGLSWSIPYCAGVLAMGWQIRPDLNPAQMKDLLFASAYVHKSGARIINPAAFIDLIRKHEDKQERTPF